MGDVINGYDVYDVYEMCMMKLINLYTTHIIYTAIAYDLYTYSLLTHVVKKVWWDKESHKNAKKYLCCIIKDSSYEYIYRVYYVIYRLIEWIWYCNNTGITEQVLEWG